MTLILSVITPTYAMQASDRRVVALNDRREVVNHVDERNKAIFVAERMTFAYTGHADIGGADTAEFFQARVASELAQGRRPEEALNVVGEMCEQYLRSLPSTTDVPTPSSEWGGRRGQAGEANAVHHGAVELLRL